MPSILTQLTDRLIAPAVERRLAASAVQKDTSSFAYGVAPTQTRTLKDAIGQAPDASYGLLYAIAVLNADVAACVKRWAGGVTGNGWHLGLMDQGAEPNRNQRKQLDELTRWLKNPNPSKRFSLLLYELVEHLAISGDAYINKVEDKQGHILELWGVHPATIRVEADEHRVITGYVQQIGTHKEIFKPGEIAHPRLPSAHNDLYGHSPLLPAMEEIGLDLQAVRSNRAIFENGLKPSAILLMESGDKDAVSRAAEMIKQRYTGAAHTHSLMALGGVKDVKPWGQTLKDMEFAELRGLATEKVANAYGVPKLFLNQKDAADYSTSDVVERMFYNTTIKPLQDIIAEVLTEEVIHSFDDSFAFYFNEPDFANADQMRKDALTAEGQKILTDDEVRERYFSLPKKTKEQRDQEEQAKQQAVTQFEPNKDTPAPKAENGQADGEAGTAAEATPTKKAVSKGFTLAEIETIRARRETIHDELEAAILPHVVSYFERQEGRYLDQLATTFKTHPHKRRNLEKAVIDDMIAPYFDDQESDNRELSIQLYADLSPSLIAGVAEAGLKIAITFDSAFSQKVVDDYLLKNALQHAKGINETTRGQLSDTLRQGIADGEGIPELRARVKSVFTEASTNRANTIARTETAQAFEYANEAAMTESGVVEEIRWLSANDSRVRPAHQLLEGTVVKLGQKFPSINGPISPGEEFSCRCTAIAVIKDSL